jgi:hypothetical protein
MVSAGVADDVIKAYIGNSSAAFNLSADNIIQVQKEGVSSAVTSEMLSHDRVLMAQAPSAPPTYAPPPVGANPYTYPPAASQPAPYQNPVSVYDMPAESSPYYSDLSPYGSWCNWPGYGWCWQPAVGLGYGYYPWGTLQYGRWSNWPGRGWVWFPGGGYRGGAYAGRAYGGGHYYGYGGASFAAGRSTVSVARIGGGSSHFGGAAHFAGGGFSHSSGGAHFSGGSGHSAGFSHH